MKKLYVQYGCGFVAPPHWLNFDASPSLLLERVPALGRFYNRAGPRFPDSVRYGNIVRGLPVPKGSCVAAFCSHVLEHLALDDFRTALRNTRRMMAEEGVFRLVVPDLEALARRYLADERPDAASYFMRESCLGRDTRPSGLPDFLRLWLGNSQHLWMWDYSSLVSELESAGFVSIRRAMPGDASDPAFSLVERRDRWVNSIGIECRRGCS